MVFTNLPKFSKLLKFPPFSFLLSSCSHYSHYSLRLYISQKRFSRFGKTFFVYSYSDDYSASITIVLNSSFEPTRFWCQSRTPVPAGMR